MNDLLNDECIAFIIKWADDATPLQISTRIAEVRQLADASIYAPESDFLHAYTDFLQSKLDEVTT